MVTRKSLDSSNAVACASSASAGGYDVVCCDGSGWGANGNKCLRPNLNSVISRVDTISHSVLNECPLGWNQDSACSTFNNYVFFNIFFYAKNSKLETTDNRFISNAIACAPSANAGSYDVVCCDGSEWAENTNNACPKVRTPAKSEYLLSICNQNPSETLTFMDVFFNKALINGNTCLEFIAALAYVSPNEPFINEVSSPTECISKVNHFTVDNNAISTILHGNTSLSGTLKQELCKPYLEL